jgi:acylphosphatase
MQQRLHIIFRGNVQGVGFRYTARTVAQRHTIAGFVKNITDGTVEVVAEASEPDLARFLAELEREMAPFIESRTTERIQATGEFHGFSVRF